MDQPDQHRADQPLAIVYLDDVVEPPVRSVGCLVAGCPCKDARIVSSRRAAFFRAFARRTGQTATRVIAAEPGWRMPISEGADRS